MAADISVRQRWIEAGVAAGITALLVALLLPAVLRAREDSRRTQSKFNLKQIGLALHNYHDTHKVFPPGGVFDAGGIGYRGWQLQIVPYLDASPVFNFDEENPWDKSRDVARFRNQLPVYINPGCTPTHDSAGFALSHYSANQHVLFRNSSVTVQDFSDGTSKTIMGGEVFANYLPYARPDVYRNPAAGIHRGPDSFGRPNTDGGWLLLADGSVRWFSKEIEPAICAILATPDGGEEIPEGVVPEPPGR